jgi:hypothetical protein
VPVLPLLRREANKLNESFITRQVKGERQGEEHVVEHVKKSFLDRLEAVDCLSKYYYFIRLLQTQIKSRFSPPPKSSHRERASEIFTK